MTMGVYKKETMKTINPKRKLMIVLASIIVFTGLGLAVWVLGFDSNITGYVISSEGMIWDDSDFAIDEESSLTSGLNKTDVLELSNPDGQFNLTVNLSTIIKDNDLGDNCEIDGDVTVKARYQSIVISDGDNVSIASGDSNFTIETTAKKFSCPQNVSTTLSLIES